MNKLKEVTAKIYKLLKDTELEFSMCDMLNIDFNGKLFRPIREAELLMSLNKAGVAGVISDDSFIDICGRANNCKWTLGKPLSEQPKETIDFLHEILV